MSNYKAPGKDKIHSGALKAGGPELLKFFKIFFKQILIEGNPRI